METLLASRNDVLAYPSLYTAVGEVVKLMSCSDVYKKYTIEHLERLILPALLTARCRLFYDETDGDLIGFLSYTILTPQSEVNFIARRGLLDWEDWMKDDTEGNLWIMDVIAPFGGADYMCRESYKWMAEQYPGRRLFFRRVAQDDRINSVMLKPQIIVPDDAVMH